MKHREEGSGKLRAVTAVAFATLALAAAAALVSSCAYYNTFYSARRYYNQALRANRQPTKPGPGGSQPTGISGATSSLLDKSIEKCAKVITFYPKSKWVDDAIFLMGQSYFLKQDYDRAQKKFQDLAVYYPKSEFVPRAAFMIGQCAYGKKDYDLAIQVLQKALLEHRRAGANYRDNALFTLGEAYWQKKNYPEALVNYRLLTGGGRRSELHFKSLLKEGQCYFEMARYDSARICLSSVVLDDPNDEEVLDALIKTGDSYAAEKNLDAAARSYRDAEALAKDFARTPVVKLRMADVELAKGNYEKAIELYRSVVSDFPRTLYASEAQFRIGYIYEVHLEDLDQAAQAYEKVREQMAKSEFASQAEFRGKGLARLKGSGKKPGESETDRAAEPGFLLAELSLFQLGKTDKAIEKYLAVEDSFPKSVYAPKSAFAVTYAFLNMKHDTASAVDAGRRVIEKFPNTEYAEAAGGILKSLDVEMSPELLEKTIPPKPVPADTLRPGAAPGKIAASSADSLQAAKALADSLGAATGLQPQSPAGASRADSLAAARRAVGQEARVDSLTSSAGILGQAARVDSTAVDSQRVGTQIPRQEIPVDSLKTTAPAKVTAPADTFVVPEPEKPEILGKDEAEQDTSLAR